MGFDCVDWMRYNALAALTIFLATLLWLSGLYYIITGWYVMGIFGPFVYSFYDEGLTYYLFGLPLLLLGIIITVVACTGCVATFMYLPCLQLSMGLALLYFAIWEAVIAGIALSTPTTRVNIHHDICESIYECLGNEVDRLYYVNGRLPKWAQSEEMTGAAITSPTMDRMHINLQCCGSNGPEDFLAHKMALPDSCCDDPGDGCVLDVAYADGCKEPLVAWFGRIVTALGVMSILIAFLTFTTALLFCALLFMTLHKRRKRYRCRQRVRISCA